MKNLNRVSVGVLAITSLVALIGPITTYAATAPSLGSLSTYGVVSSTFTNSNTAPYTIIEGDVCATTHTAPVPLLITGIKDTPCAPLKGTDQLNALNGAGGLNTQVCISLPAGAIALDSYDVDGPGGFAPGTFPAGCYEIDGAMNITLSTTVTLDAQGDPNAVFIFRSKNPAQALNTGNNSSISLINSANYTNVFWAPTGLATIGAFTTGGIPPAGATFVGNILDAAGITLGHFANLLGRALAFGGTITTDANTISISPRLTLVKTVTNDNGGTRTVADFPLTAAGPITITGVSGAASITNTGVTAGTYTLSETTQTDYTAGTYSCIKNGVTTAGNSISLIAGDVATCTIVNNDKAPSLTLNKIVSGGTAIESAWTLTAAGPTTISGPGAAGSTDVVSGPTFSSGTYILSESVGASNYVASSWNCVKNGGAPVSGASITLGLGDIVTCTITNTYTPPPSSGGGGSSIMRIDVCPDGDYSYSYYDGICGTAPIVADRIVPLIGLLKVPTPLALPSGSGSVIYNYVVWNVGGKQALTSVTLTDDKCNSILFLSGDLNNNNKLDITEKWKYSCTSTLLKTTTNTAIASGYSDDIYHQLVIATAVATVVVGAPLTPPLISIVKVPSRLTPFPFGGGDVTYTYTVRNPGIVAMHDVFVTDDKCAPVSISIGDTNHDNLLDITETWVYTCQTHVPVSTMNTATAEGQANGFTAIAHAFAHVLVSNHVGSLSIITPTSASKTIPSLPNTGLPPEDSIPWNIILLISILLILASYIGVHRRGNI